MEIYSHGVTEEQHGARLDVILAEINPDRSRSQVQTWIEKEHVRVNEKVVKANFKCQTSDLIEWMIPEIEPLQIEPEAIPLDIIYEDSDLLVVNKARGMVVHPSAGHGSGTLVNALLYHCDDLSGINGVERPGIVHRLDKDTSGLLVVAKNDRAHLNLSEQFTERTVERRYIALVHGEIPHENGLVDAPIGRDPKNRQRMAVVDNGKPAITRFVVLERFPEYTLIECQLETGRTHQIRVHMRYIDFPLVGDPLYGPRKTLPIDGQALHAKILGFIHPVSGEWLRFESEPPAYFQNTIENIKKTY